MVRTTPVGKMYVHQCLNAEVMMSTVPFRLAGQFYVSCLVEWWTTVFAVDMVGVFSPVKTYDLAFWLDQATWYYPWSAIWFDEPT